VLWASLDQAAAAGLQAQDIPRDFWLIKKETGLVASVGSVCSDQMIAHCSDRISLLEFKLISDADHERQKDARPISEYASRSFRSCIQVLPNCERLIGKERRSLVITPVTVLRSNKHTSKISYLVAEPPIGCIDQSTLYVYIGSGCVSNILYRDRHIEDCNVLIQRKVAFNIRVDSKPGPLRIKSGPGGYGGSLSLSSAIEQGEQQKRSANESQNDLRLSQLKHLTSCFGHRLLSYQVVLLTLLGFGCAGVSATGIALVLDSCGWRRDRLFGLGLIVIFSPLGTTLWGWAVYGHPWTFWALWGFGDCVEWQPFHGWTALAAPWGFIWGERYWLGQGP
jgi:hypothetical protein